MGPPSHSIRSAHNTAELGALGPSSGSTVRLAERPPGAALRAASSERKIKTTPRPPPSLAISVPHNRQPRASGSRGRRKHAEGLGAEEHRRGGRCKGLPRAAGPAGRAREVRGGGGLQGQRAPLRAPGPAARLPGRRAGGRAGRPRERGAARRGGRCAAQKLHSSPILGSAGLLGAPHSLSAARAAPGALIGSQRPGAGADRLMRARAPLPLGERPSGRRRGGGARAGKERKGKGLGGRGRAGGGEQRKGWPAARRQASSCQEGPRLPRLPLASAGRPRAWGRPLNPHPRAGAGRPADRPAFTPAVFRLDSFAGEASLFRGRTADPKAP